MADDEGGGDANPFNFLAKSKKKGTEAKGTSVPKGRPASFTSKDYNGPIPVETTPSGTTGSVKPGVPADLVIPMPRRDVRSLKPTELLKLIRGRDSYLDWTGLAKRIARREVRHESAHRVLLSTVFSALGLITSDRFKAVEAADLGTSAKETEPGVAEGFRKVGLPSGCSLDHASRLHKSKLTSSPTCPYCCTYDETAEHIFWFFWQCTRWDTIRKDYPTLLRLVSIVGTQWPSCFLHCGWIELYCDYGIPLLHNLDFTYEIPNLARDTHQMFLTILLARHTASQVLRSTPQTPPNIFTPPSTPHTIQSSPSSCVQFWLIQPIKPVIWEPKKEIYIYRHMYTYLIIFTRASFKTVKFIQWSSWSRLPDTHGINDMVYYIHLHLPTHKDLTINKGTIKTRVDPSFGSWRFFHREGDAWPRTLGLLQGLKVDIITRGLAWKSNPAVSWGFCGGSWVLV